MLTETPSSFPAFSKMASSAGHAIGAAPNLFFFGLPGVGKTHCGQVLRQCFGYSFHDGDSWLPADLKDSLQRGHGFTDEQRDRFAEEISCCISKAKVAEAQQAAEEGRAARPVAIAQATFKQRHRDLIRKAHPDMVFVWVQAAEKSRMRRLRERDSVVDVALGGRMASDFEPPVDETHVVLVNDLDDEPVEDAFRDMLHQAMMSQAIVVKS